MHTNSSVLLIGSGRLAQNLQYWNSLLENPNNLLLWDRNQDPQLLKVYLNKSGWIWLAISDSAINSFYETYLSELNHKIVHFSGALSDKRLYCAHPLMSFTHKLFAAETYSKIHFVINGFENLAEAMPNFKNQFTVLNSENKSYYHALCVLSGNFPQLIWNEVSHNMKSLGLPPEALDHYIKQITENYLDLKEKSITGPLVRKDYVTIEKNISSLGLSDASKKLKNIYVALTKEFTL